MTGDCPSMSHQRRSKFIPFPSPQASDSNLEELDTTIAADIDPHNGGRLPDQIA